MKIYELEPFAVGFMEADRNDRGYRIACGIKKFAENVPLKIDTSEWFVGLGGNWGNAKIKHSRDAGIRAREEDRQQQLEHFPSLAADINRIYDYFTPLDLEDHIRNNVKTETERMLDRHFCCWGAGGGHSNPDYELFLRVGTTGLREKIQRFRTIHTDKDDFYDALSLCLDAIEILSARYQALAEKMMPLANQEDAKILTRIISAFDNIPYHTPRNFFEAAQMFWLLFSFLDIDSPGLFDLTMGTYYQDHDKEDRYHCLEKLWQLFFKTRTWNLCISGSDEFGNVFVNDLTYDVLRVAREFRYNTPNITMRMSKNTPKELWEAAVDTIATGIGMPAIYNDECVCTALEAIGIPASDAHKYCMNGCNQIDIFGKSHMGLEDGEINMAKALEFVLFNGVCQNSQLKLGLETGDPSTFETFDDFYAAYIKQVSYLADTIVNVSNKCQEAYSIHAPHPWRSLFTQGCIEKGLDMKNKGPIYGHGQILTEGMADSADSLSAIKHFVYDEKKYTMAELVSALKANFESWDDLYRDFSTYVKFGNDISSADEMYVNISDYVYRYFRNKPTFRGGYFGVGCSTFYRAPDYGIRLGALPNGKKKGDALLTDSIGATPGRDKNGPTALLNSVLKANQYLATSGNVMQMRFSKSQFNTPSGKAAFINLAKTYFNEGGQTLQVNVVSKEELLDALDHPENHENLIVRVGGFSQYFNKLSRDQKDNIIQRTEITM